MELPHWLDGEIWGEYVGHRADMKKPLSERAARMTLKKLEGMYVRGLDPNEALMNSVMNGWQGVFDCEAKHEKSGRIGNSAVDRVRRACGLDGYENGVAPVATHDGNLRPQMVEQLRGDPFGNVVEGDFRHVLRRA
jgi:hypothetical protein